MTSRRALSMRSAPCVPARRARSAHEQSQTGRTGRHCNGWTRQASWAPLRAPVGARALVAVYAGIENPPPAIGLALGGRSHVRFGADVDAVLMLDQDEVRLLGPDDLKAEPLASPLAFPLARVTARPGKGLLLPAGSAARMSRAWRTLLAAEAGAAMIGAIEIARQHVSVRMQFGK